MSGIVGMYCLDDRPVERGDLQRMLQSLKRRGPDGSEVLVKGSVGLGHCLLQTTPESLEETLPLSRRSGDLMLTADARIDNRDELISELGIQGRSAKKTGDGELILAAYEKWGKGCPTRLVGDFAFAIWDHRQQVLFCARDHFGVKPIYYYYTGRIFALASEIKALLRLREVPRGLNEARIADYLVSQLEGLDQTSTFFQGIFRLPPGQSLTASRANVSVQRYWSLDSSKEIRYGSNREYTEAFLEIFTEAVNCRLRSPTKVGSMLSGGLDSSAIVGVATQLLSNSGIGPLHTFSAVSGDQANCAETRSINSVLSGGGVQAHRVQCDHLGAFLEDLEYVPRHTDDPFDNSIILPQIINVAARRQGVKVLLDGVDGDLVASHGLHYLTYLLRAGSWKTAVVEALGSSYFYRRYYSPWALLYQSGRAAVPDRGRRLWRRLHKGKNLDATLENSIINKGFARRIGLGERLRMLCKNENKTSSSTLREAHCRSLNSPYITVALERYDRVAAAYSVEPRHSLFDKRLVEFCFAVPWEQKVRHGWTKILLRRAMCGILPDNVRWRRGWEHLGPQFSGSLMKLRQRLVNNVLKDDLNKISEYINMDTLARVDRGQLSGEDSNESENIIWQVATLALFMKYQNF